MSDSPTPGTTRKPLLLHGDVREQLRALPAESVHCVVTSPPYYGLRAYGTEPQVWGGDPGCCHAWMSVRTKRGNGSGGTGIASAKQVTHPGSYVTDTKDRATYSDWCQTCGAWRGELGLEPTLDMFIGHLVEIFREIRRVLRRDGTCWVNLGDSYASSPNGKRAAEYRADGSDDRTFRDKPFSTVGGRIKEGDLCGQPWRLALALQADGWYLRRDVIWHKTNAKPESVKSRPATSHEYLFLLTRTMDYFWDDEAVREPSTCKDRTVKRTVGGAHKRDLGRNSADGRSKPTSADRRGYERVATAPTRRCRSVWTIPTQSFREAHFATFPERLVEPCILAGTSAHGCCGCCGAPYARIVELGEPDREHQRACGGNADGAYRGTAVKDYTGTGAQNASEVKARILAGMSERITTGWQPICDCNPLMAGEPIPCTVLDPFAGSGTTLLVAERLGRSGIGIELQADYVEIARRRLALDRALALAEAREERE